MSFSKLALTLASLSVSLLVVSPGCKKDEGGGKPAGKAADRITMADKKEAQQIFTSRCVSCHGNFGRGDGPASAGLTPKPRNLQEPAWQKSVTDEHIEKIIVGGGAAVGKNAAMPANPDLEGKPQIVKALRAHVRSLGTN
jgi:mono/diheme cytochrome c family protein